jgi:hypothetical protein
MSDSPRRQRFHDNEDERVDAREDRRGSPLLVLALLGGGLVLLVALATGVFVLRSQHEAAEVAQAEAVARMAEADAAEQKDQRNFVAAKNAGQKMADARPAPISRDEFKAKVMGKSAEEVIESVGKPDDTSEVEGKSSVKTWHYRERTIDPATSSTDAGAEVTLEDGTVTKVTFF